METCWCGNKKLNNYSKHYYTCPACHTLISKVDFNKNIYEVKNEEKNLYGKNYWKIMMQKMTSQSSLDGVIDYYMNDRVIYWLKYILKYIPINKKVAEIGCGLGQLAYAMKSMGYDQTAYELSPEICLYIQETLNVHVRSSEFQSYTDNYDAVLAFDLIEHILEPEEFLKNIFNRLTGSGVLCIQIPLYDYDLEYEEMKNLKPKFKTHLTEFQHIFLYSKESIQQLLKKIGFQYINFEPACFGDDYDMFIFAAATPFVIKKENEVMNYLNEIPNGRIIKALISLYDTKNEQMKQLMEKESVIQELAAALNAFKLRNEELERQKIIWENSVNK